MLIPVNYNESVNVEDILRLLKRERRGNETLIFGLIEIPKIEYGLVVRNLNEIFNNCEYTYWLDKNEYLMVKFLLECITGRKVKW